METLKQIFDQYAEEMITDEQARQVSEVVIALIEGGKFDWTNTNAETNPND